MTQPGALSGDADLGVLIGKEFVAADGAIHSSRSKEVRHDAGLAGRDACQRCRTPPSVSSCPSFAREPGLALELSMAEDASSVNRSNAALSP